MKKSILAAMLLASTAFMASAETESPRALRVNLADGTVKSFALAASPVITFPDSRMRIAAGEESAEWSRSEISSMTFGDITNGIASLAKGEEALTISGLTASAPGKTIRIFTPAGIMISATSDTADLSPLAPGLYIINADNHSIKYIRK